MKKRKSPILLISFLVILGVGMFIFNGPLSPAGQHPDMPAQPSDVSTTGPAGPESTPEQIQEGLPSAAGVGMASADGQAKPAGNAPGSVGLEMKMRPEEMTMPTPKDPEVLKKAAAARLKPDPNRGSSLAFSNNNKDKK